MKEDREEKDRREEKRRREGETSAQSWLWLGESTERVGRIGVRGKPARLRKAGYGLVKAPREWVEWVCEGMKEMGLQQCNTDPCVWKLVKETSQGPQFQVLTLFHIDDFMLAGRKR